MLFTEPKMLAAHFYAVLLRRQHTITLLVKFRGAAAPNYKRHFEKILPEAFQEWENSSNSKTSFRYVSEPPADITCEFVPSFPKEKPSLAGQTHYLCKPHNVTQSNLTVNTTA
ncbi:MAG: hypothetical protein ACRD22_07520 [Terriglobia bacterium]